MGASRRTRDLQFRDWLSSEQIRRSPFHVERLARSGYAASAFRTLSHVERIPVCALDDVATVGDVVSAQVSDSKRLRARLAPCWWADTWPVPTAYARDDLELFESLAERAFARAGIARGDVVLDAASTCSLRDRKFLEAGARSVGASVLPESSRNDVTTTVIAGTADAVAVSLAQLSTESLADSIHTLFVFAPRLDDDVRAQLRTFLTAQDAAIVLVWSPPPVMAPWSQCRNGMGFHLELDHEIVELLDPISRLPTPSLVAGELVWSGMGWGATTWLRVATGVGAVTHSGQCPGCGSTTPRLDPTEGVEGFPAALDAHVAITNWFAGLFRTRLGEELVIWASLTSSGESLGVLAMIDREIGDARVIFVSEDEVRRRQDEAMGQRVVDRRAYFQEPDDVAAEKTATADEAVGDEQ